MAQAIFHKEFNLTPKGRGMSWNVKPSDEPQTHPQEVIDAAVKAGAATVVAAKAKNNTK